MRKRSRLLAYGSAALLVVLGIAAAVVLGGTFGQVLTIVLIGLGLVLATALVFYEVGLSEDRERAREEAAAERASRREARKNEPGVPRRRLGRMRGQRRRLK